MHSILRNLQYAMRQLRKSPVFTATAILTLALGIGANTAIFTVVYATLLAPMPYPQPDQLVMVWSKIQDNRNSIAAQDFLDWKSQNTVFQDLNAWTGGSFNLRATREQPEYLEGRADHHARDVSHAFGRAVSTMDVISCQRKESRAKITLSFS